MIEEHVYQGMWIRLPTPVKERIAKVFGITRSGPTHVNDNVVISDGYLDRDLAVLTVKAIQKGLGSKETNLFHLWNEYIKKIQDEIDGKTQVTKEEPKVERKRRTRKHHVKQDQAA